MYHPYFRGKQFDLLTIKETAPTLSSAKFTPIIEPVRGTLGPLTRALDAIVENHGRAILIVNPEHGELSGAGESLTQMLQQKYLKPPRPCPRRILSPSFRLLQDAAISCNNLHKKLIFNDMQADQFLHSAAPACTKVGNQHAPEHAPELRASEANNICESLRFLLRRDDLKIAAISDTHGRRKWSIPACDVFIHGGDITGWGLLEETAEFAAWLKEQMESELGPRHTIIVAGNHDECFESTPEKVRELFGESVHILQDRPLVIDGVTFYGSPWTPPFMNRHFMAEENRLAELYKQIPEEVDVLVTHGPPRGILDPGWTGTTVGSTALAAAIAHRRVRNHVFGHLHGAGGGMVQHGYTTYYNVAACDEKCVFRNEPRVFEV